MKNWLIGAVVVAVAATMTPVASEAKRLGGGSSSGLQRNMPARTAPDAPPAKPAAPAQQGAPAQQAAPAAAGATGAAAAAGKRSWLGPIAGLAAGLGLAALMSHLGLGEAFANFLMLALLVVAGIALFVFIRRKMGGAAAASRQGPAWAGVGAAQGTGSASPAQVAWPQREAPSAPAGPAAEPAALQRSALESIPSATPASGAAAAVTQAFVPASFDAEGFERIAKMIFIRMQAANDSANLDDLRQFTTPEMFAALKLDLLERGSSPQTTEVGRIEAQVLDVAEEAERQIVSVRYRGEVVEEAGGAPVAFDEVWHLVKPLGEGTSWAIAGIEQMS
jgi:predicted lipid-binding transport protein (Tim44 family)